MIAKLVLVMCIVCSIECTKIKGVVIASAQTVNLDDYDSKPVTIGCMLQTHANISIHSAHNLTIQRGNTILPSKILNDSFIVHQVDLNETKGCDIVYKCMLQDNGELKHTAIHVGRPPLRVQKENFTCVSENRKEMVCDYFPNEFYNCHTTNVTMELFSDAGLVKLCDITFKKYGHWQWRSHLGTCSYQTAYHNFTFRLNTTNEFGTTSDLVTIDHFDHVKAPAPTNLNVSIVNSTTVEVSWYLSINIPRNIEYEFTLSSKYGRSNISNWVTEIKAQQAYRYVFHRLFKNTQYDLKIRGRIVRENPRNNDSLYWSAEAHISFKTPATAPSGPPKTAPGAYTIKTVHAAEEIEIFWEHIPPQEQNGDGFQYKVKATSLNGASIWPLNVGENSAVFTAQEDCRVDVTCSNDFGLAQSYNTIIVSKPRPDQQPKIKCLHLENNEYNVSWIPPNDVTDLTNYTILYCETKTIACSGFVNIVTVPPSSQSFIVKSDKWLNFGVAANYPNYSSQLVWKECTVSPNISITKPQLRDSNLKAKSFDLTINHGCTDRSLVNKYKLQVTAVDSSELIMTKVLNSDEKNYHVSNLSPNTRYNVSVKAIDNNGITYESNLEIKTVVRDFSQILLFIVIGIICSSFITLFLAHRLRKIFDIDVELPFGLMGIDQDQNNNDHSNLVTEEILVKGYQNPYIEVSSDCTAAQREQKTVPAVKLPPPVVANQTISAQIDRGGYVLPVQVLSPRNLISSYSMTIAADNLAGRNGSVSDKNSNMYCKMDSKVKSRENSQQDYIPMTLNRKLIDQANGNPQSKLSLPAISTEKSGGYVLPTQLKVHQKPSLSNRIGSVSGYIAMNGMKNPS